MDRERLAKVSCVETHGERQSEIENAGMINGQEERCEARICAKAMVVIGLRAAAERSEAVIDTAAGRKGRVAKDKRAARVTRPLTCRAGWCMPVQCVVAREWQTSKAAAHGDMAVDLQPSAVVASPRGRVVGGKRQGTGNS